MRLLKEIMIHRFGSIGDINAVVNVCFSFKADIAGRQEGVR